MDRTEFELNNVALYHADLVRCALAQVEQGARRNFPSSNSSVTFEQFGYKVHGKQFIVLWKPDANGSGQAFVPVDLAGLKDYLGPPIENLLKNPR